MSGAIFGRKWELNITTTSGDVITASSLANGSATPDGLKITFEMSFSIQLAVWVAYIEIYNLDPQTTAKVIQQGSVVSLQAGYDQGGSYGEIFRGRVLKAIFEKRDVVDFVVGVQCVVGGDFLVNNFVSFAMGPQQTQASFIAAMAGAARKPFSINDPGGQLDSTRQLPKSQVFFGDPKHYLDLACRKQNVFVFPDASGSATANIATFDVTNTTPAVIFSAPLPAGMQLQQNTTYSIIGSPQQVSVAGGMSGVRMRVLLDPRLVIQNPPIIVRIANTTVINQELLPIGSDGVQGVAGPGLNLDGLYGAIGISHKGDSRGQAWYTEVLLLNLRGNQLVSHAFDGQDRRYQSVATQTGGN